MGMIHETGSEIVLFEERTESVYLKASTPDTHLFLPCWYAPHHVIEAAHLHLMERAKTLFALGEDAKAKAFRDAAIDIKDMPYKKPPKPRTVEVTKEYLRELVRILNENPEWIE